MELLAHCKKFDLVRKQVSGSDGKPHAFEIVQHPGSVVILPLLGDDRVVLVRNFRHAIEKELYELPAGTLDEPGEDRADAAARELTEETGYRAGRVRALWEFYPSPGFLSEIIYAYVATDLTQARQQLEPTERIMVEEMGLDAAIEMVRSNRITDAKTIVTLLRWALEQGRLR